MGSDVVNTHVQQQLFDPFANQSLLVGAGPNAWVAGIREVSASDPVLSVSGTDKKPFAKRRMIRNLDLGERGARPPCRCPKPCSDRTPRQAINGHHRGKEEGREPA